MSFRVSVPLTGNTFNFQVSQGSVATHLRCSEKSFNAYTQNFIRNLRVKFWKSVYIYQVLIKNQLSRVLETQYIGQPPSIPFSRCILVSQFPSVFPSVVQEQNLWLIEQGLTCHKRIIGHIRKGFYGWNDPTNSVKALKEVVKEFCISIKKREAQLSVSQMRFLPWTNQEK